MTLLLPLASLPSSSSLRASGVSLWAYWTANFLWDYSIAITQCLVFTFALFCARAASYSNNDFALILAIGFLFSICVLLRFYLFSNYVGDIRMAQIFYFYGSLLIQFVLIIFYSLMVYTVQDGNASSPFAHLISIICTIIDPVFGYLFIVMIQNDFLGIRSQNNEAPVTAMETSGTTIIAISVMIFVYLLGICYFEIGSSQLLMYFHQIFPPRRVQPTPGARNQQEDFSVDVTDTTINVHLPDRPKIRTIGGVDPDVEDEKIYVSEIVNCGKINTTQHAIFVSLLNKVYYGRGTQPTKVAVKNMSLSIHRGEIFGL
jgi:hypothetical protein